MLPSDKLRESKKPTNGGLVGKSKGPKNRVTMPPPKGKGQRNTKRPIRTPQWTLTPFLPAAEITKLHITFT